MKGTLLTLVALGLTVVTAPVHAQYRTTSLKCVPDSVPPYVLNCAVAGLRDSSGQGGGPQMRLDSAGLGGGPQRWLIAADLMLPTFRVVKSSADVRNATRRVVTLTGVATLTLVLDSVRPPGSKVPVR